MQHRLKFAVLKAKGKLKGLVDEKEDNQSIEINGVH